MARGRVHIVGAGLAGLAAAIALRNKAEVVLYEASSRAGGRCRSFHDDALGTTIDNGNHLVLTGNRAAIRFARAIGAVGLESAPRAEFPFLDLASGARWTVDAGSGRSPLWIFSPKRRPPGTTAADFLSMAKLLRIGDGARLDETLTCSGPFYERFLRPVLVAALNSDPAASSAALARAVAMETLALGGRACRPTIARQGLSHAFVDPALKLLRDADASIRFNHRLRRLIFAESRVGALDFGSDLTLLGPHDCAVLAVPGAVAASLVPGLAGPSSHNAIVNAHFAVDAPADFPPLLGLVNATTEWIFAFPGRISITISDANRYLEVPREALAETIWSEVCRATGLPARMPAWQVIKEKRATFAATPEENARRPATRSAWSNLMLAGDWTATGLPATIEGAVRSGNFAASAAMHYIS